MKLVIDIDESDYKELCHTVMSIDEMDNTTQGRVYGAIVRGGMKKFSSVEPEKCGDVGEISDGYHTFNQLYHQRAILFAAIVNQNKGISWKSYKHSDGKYCFDSNGEWFIVGVDTPEGHYTYHYSKEYWDYFDCQILECGKEWDGHTEDDVTRLLSLTSVEPERKFIEKVLETLREMDDAVDVICNLDVDAVLDRMEVDG